jgi:hypothetical protein
MPPRERRRRDWFLPFQVTGLPIKPWVACFSIQDAIRINDIQLRKTLTHRAVGAQAGACPLPNLRFTVCILSFHTEFQTSESMWREPALSK